MALGEALRRSFDGLKPITAFMTKKPVLHAITTAIKGATALRETNDRSYWLDVDWRFFGLLIPFLQAWAEVKLKDKE